MSNWFHTSFVAALLLGLAGHAHATVSVTATQSTTTPADGMKSAYTGVTTLTFDGSTALPAGFSGGAVLTGNQPLQYAAPSGDTSNFFAVGTAPNYTGSATFTPGGSWNYFGLYWGSIDAFNTVSFSLNGVNVASFSGSDLPPSTGNQTAANTNEFVDFLFSPGTAYDEVTFGTTSANFELDNVAYGRVPVPEPASLALLGTAIAGMVGIARRRKPTARSVVAA